MDNPPDTRILSNYACRLFYYGVVLLFFLQILVLSGCAKEIKKAPVKEPPAQPVVKEKVVEKKVAPEQVAILISSNSPAYSDIAKDLMKKLGKRSKVYSLKGDPTRGKKLLDEIRHSDRKQVVAIGLLATRAAGTLKDHRVVFNQVFNYEDLKVIKPQMKGISAVPSTKVLFDTWKKIDPNITKVAVVTGRNKNALIKSAKQSAEKFGITLMHKVVKTDLDMVYTIKHLPDDVQGIWFLPDNRVLSSRAIRDVMSYGVKHGQQMAVFQPELLKLGGLFSYRYKTSDVVNQTLKRLKQSDHKKTIPGNDVFALSDAAIKINANVVRRMSMTVPDDLKKYVQ